MRENLELAAALANILNASAVDQDPKIINRIINPPAIEAPVYRAHAGGLHHETNFAAGAGLILVLGAGTLLVNSVASREEEKEGKE